MDVSLVVAAGIAAAGFVLTLVFLPGRVPAKAGRIEPVETSPDRRLALFGLLLALLARRAQKQEADPAILAALSSTANGRYPHDWSEAQRGRAVAQDVIEPLSILLLASSVSNDAGNANGGASIATRETILEASETLSNSDFSGS